MAAPIAAADLAASPLAASPLAASPLAASPLAASPAQSAQPPQPGRVAPAPSQPLDAAYRLSRDVVPSRYGLHLWPDFKAMRYRATEPIEIQIAAPTRSVTLHALELDIASAKARVKKKSFIAKRTLNAVAQTGTLEFEKPLPAGPAMLELEFSGPIGSRLTGFHGENKAGEVPVIARGYLIASGMMNRSTREEIWDWIRANWADIKEKIPPEGQNAILGMTFPLCDVRRRAEVEALFQATENRIESSTQNYARTMDLMGLCIDLRTRLKVPLEAWLAQGYGRPQKADEKATGKKGSTK